MFSKLFGKKKDNFYLELKEDNKGSAPKAPAVTKPEAVTPAPAPTVSAATATAAKAVEEPKKNQKTSVKKDKKGKAAQEKPAVVETPKTTPATNGKVEPKEVEFATKYMITPSLSRRRPGPSLNAFKDMAKKAKVPNK
ncbi:MAG: hypothetical protein N5P05_001832 [Chroococcopsis gigantea SAG 12.99]|jgi:hypothetical protein|nr:hypothetical protein [Chlorogloea purpurea SAG 13.99]MDV3000226.1 hypothetical protein [Chroococcopsis gigantea SAG 12.99]